MVIRTKQELDNFVMQNKDKIVCAGGIGFYGNGLAVSPVFVSFHHEEGKSGFFSEDLWGYKDRWTLGKHGLDKIANAIGLSWISSKQVDVRLDDDGRVLFVKHEVVWRRPTTSGIDLTGISTGEYNYLEDYARLKYKDDVYDKVWDDTKKRYTNGKKIASKGDPITEQIERRRNYSGSLAETNAKVRALNEALPELPRVFTQEEIKKTLVVFRVVVDIAGITEVNPALMQVYHAKLLGLADVIYNQPMQNQILIDQRTTQNEAKSYAQVDNTQKPTAIEQPNLTEPQSLDIEIEKMIKEKGYTGKALDKWHSFDENLKLEFLEHLKKL